MAAWDNWAKRFTRLLHLIEVKGEYEPTAVADTIPTDLALVQTDVQGIATDIQTQIDAINAYIIANGDVEGGLAAIATALGTVKTDAQTADTDLGDIITDYGDKPTDQDVCHVMDKVHADLLAAVNVTRGDADPKCKGLGYYFKSQDTGDSADSTVKKLCDSCKAHGYLITGTSNTPTISFPVTDEYSEELDQS